MLHISALIEPAYLEGRLEDSETFARDALALALKGQDESAPPLRDRALRLERQTEALTYVA